MSRAEAEARRAVVKAKADLLLIPLQHARAAVEELQKRWWEYQEEYETWDWALKTLTWLEEEEVLENTPPPSSERGHHGQ